MPRKKPVKNEYHSLLEQGEAHLEARAFDDALACFQKMHELEPNNAASWI